MVEKMIATNVKGSVVFMGLTRVSSAAASGTEHGCGLNGFNHVKTKYHAGSPSAAALG
jgi:hypothetical protein